MILDRWRARRGITTRTPPTDICCAPDPRLTEVVESLRIHANATVSLGEPIFHHRWDGAMQLVGLDALDRSRSDIRQRLIRLVHEVDLMHWRRARRRILAVMLCNPENGDLRDWHRKLVEEEPSGDWNAARRRIAILAIDKGGGHVLFGGDREIELAVNAWATESEATPAG